MNSPVPVPPRSPESLQQRAIENVRFIRETMERAASFTALSGFGAMLIGSVALVAAVAAAGADSSWRWLETWLLAALVAVIVGTSLNARKARRLKIALLARPARRFFLALIPPLAAGAILTPGLFNSGRSDLLPAVWLLLYGAGIVTAGAFSVKPVPIMGACFMALGTAALALPPGWGNLFM
ncbi:MAG TPA: hypothetical protein VFW45_14815, partial [Candidatus Polarisedimenticolia bacterium]|nr:hypothetical protein [Candidatus Polarisedimenticolia bacterium]